jgi:DNA phosphorothioation-dependent restriction protein DptH
MNNWIRLLAERITRTYRNTPVGHTARINGLTNEEARELCSLLQDSLSPQWDVMVVGQHTTDELVVSLDLAIERRNNKSQSRLFIVPANLVAEAAASLADTEVHDVTEYLRPIANKLYRQLPSQVQAFVGVVIKRTPASARLDYLCSLPPSPSLEECGREMWRLGLIPDLSPTEDRLSINRITVSTLSDLRRAAGSLHHLVESTGLGDESLKQSLTNVLRETGTANPQAWLRRIAEENLALSFDHWSFPEVDEVNLKSLEVHSFRDPRKNKAYTWSGLTLDEGETLKVSTADKKSKVTVRWSTKPEVPTGEPLYEISLETTDAQPTPLMPLVVQKHKKGRTQSWSFRPSDIEDSAGGTLRVKVTVRSYSKEQEDWISADSDEFLLVSETMDVATVPTFSPVRSLPDFMLERAASTKNTPQITQQVVEEGAVKVELDERQRRKIPLTVVLQEAERKLLEDPNTTPSLSLLLSGNTQWHAEDLKYLKSETQEDVGPDWKSKRRRLFAKISQALDGKGVVAACELLMFKDEILSYCRSYASTLEELLETSDDPTLITKIAALMHLDSIQVQEKAADGEVSTVGILLSPLHPLRLLWHLSHEALIRYWMQQVADPQVKATLPPPKMAEQLDASNFPAFLGAPISACDQSLFYLCDTPLFHWPLYISAREQNPHRIRTLVRSALGLMTPEWVTAGDEAAAQALKGSLATYYELHPYVRSLKLTAVNPGDGGLLVRALSALEEERHEKSATTEDSTESDLNFEVRLYGPLPLHQIGSVFDECTTLRNRGQGLPLKLDRLFRSGTSFLRPHLFWAKRDLQRIEDKNGEPPSESHISFVTDYFRLDPTLVPYKEDRVASVSTYALQTDMVGEFIQAGGHLSWVRTVWLPDSTRLAAHPSDKKYTKELIRLHDVLLKTAARLSGGAEGEWPATQIAVSESKFSLFSRLHEVSDWVVTIDRNMGVEMFDSPALNNEGLAENARRYLIDYSPTQVNSGQQLMISTAWMDEVNELIRETLREMLIAPSDLACEEVLRLLKSISGRLVMRVARQPAVAKEAVSLAVVREVLRGRGDLSNAFLVPVDEHIPLLVSAAKAKGSNTSRRPDMMLVRPRLDKKASLEVDFIEVKYRRHRAMASDPRLWDDILEAASAGEEKLSRVYFPQAPEKELELPLRRRQLKIALSFYVERAVRHGLMEIETAQKIEQWFEQFQREDLTLEVKKRGFIYCPELNFDVEEQIYEGMNLTLIGRESLPRYTSFHISEISMGAPAPITPPNIISADVTSWPQAQPSRHPAEAPLRQHESVDENASEVTFLLQQEAQQEVSVNIGEDTQRKIPVYFKPSIRGNPHALIVGIPGMGKTKAIFNLCRGLARQGINPFVIDFHGDLATDLQSDSGGRPCKVLDAASGLRFNPLEVDAIRRNDERGWIAHYFEVAEILGSIFPTFGELQVGNIRDVLRICYEQRGFKISPSNTPAPSFSDFWRQLQSRAKSERELKKIATRLESIFQLELFRENQQETFSLDELLSQVTVLDLHRLELEENQRIAASFFLQLIYRDMFSRPIAKRLRTAVVFDEAHRVARLRLIPKMMQECRKYGIMFIVSSQRIEDFDQGVLDSARNHLYLCLNNPDARRLAAYISGGTTRSDLVDKLQTLPKFHALFRSEEYQPFVNVRLVKP